MKGRDFKTTHTMQEQKTVAAGTSQPIGDLAAGGQRRRPADVWKAMHHLPDLRGVAVRTHQLQRPLEQPVTGTRGVCSGESVDTLRNVFFNRCRRAFSAPVRSGRQNNTEITGSFPPFALLHFIYSVFSLWPNIIRDLLQGHTRHSHSSDLWDLNKFGLIWYSITA